MKIITDNILNIASEIKTGKTPPTSNPEYFGDEINWYTPSDLDKEKFLGKSQRGITQKAIQDKKAALFKPNTVLIGGIGDIGKLGITTEVSSSNQQITGLFPNIDKITAEYLFYWLKANKRLLVNSSKSSLVPILNNNQLGKIKVTYPDNIPDQLHIANLLSKAENLINQRKQSIRLLDEFLKSTFLEMFGDPVRNEKGWDQVPLSKLGSLDRGVSKNRPRNAPELLGGKYPLIQTGEVTNAGLFIRKYTHTYSELGLKQSKLWKKGTMLITIAANIAQTSILSFEACFPDSIVGFVANDEEANTIYVHYLFIFFQRLLENSATQTAQKNINLDILRKLPVPKPPIELQTQFAQIVEKTETFKTQYQQSLQELENLYGSLSQKAFKGELNFSKQQSVNLPVKKEKAVKVYQLPEPELSIAAEPTAQKRSGKSDAYVRKMVLAAEIANQLYNEPTFGHVKFMKLLYLCEEAGNMQLMTNYKKFAAGPFDNKLINSVDTYFKKNKWFKVNEVKTVQGKRYTYSPDINIEKYKHLYDGCFSEYQSTISQLINLLRKKDTKHCEIVATLYYVWKELKSNKSLVNDQLLLKGFYNFHKEKEKFPSALVLEKKKWIEQENVIP